MTWVVGMLLWTMASSPDEGPCAVPEFLAPFVGKDACAIHWVCADLNRDGNAADAVALVGKRKAGTSDLDPDAPRQVLILTAQADGVYKLQKRNHKIVPCANCEQTCHDPYGGLQAGPGKLTLTLEFGCTQMSTTEYTFAYSRRDKTWQLVRVMEDEGHMDARRRSQAVYTPPKDFGKIDFADFDPDHWKGKQ